MINVTSPELCLESKITESAKHDQLSQADQRMILRALKDVDIPIEELIDFAFYVADEIFKKENRYPSNWLKEFVLFVRNLQTPYRFLVKGAWFSPGTEILNVLLEAIKNAQKSLDVCVFNFTDERLANALLSAAERGVKVRILTERTSMYQRGSAIASLRNRGVNTIVVERNQKLMHNKYMIIDNKYVLSGSNNWTKNALKNDENLVLVSEMAVVRQYRQKFQDLLDRSNNSREVQRKN